jgi:cyclic beta-1,2-glucan synthetase
MYQLILESFLGFKRTGNILKFQPCIPEEWESFTVNYIFGKTNYQILITQNKETNKAISIFANDKELVGDSIILNDDGKTHEIKITLSLIEKQKTDLPLISA